MPRGGARPNSGGARAGAGRKAAGVPMRSLTVWLPESAHAQLAELQARLRLKSAGEVVRAALEHISSET